MPRKKFVTVPIIEYTLRNSLQARDKEIRR